MTHAYLNEKVWNFENYNGPINDGYSHAEFCIHMGRQMGKTTKLVYALPENEKVTVVVYKSSRLLKEVIGNLRPGFNLKNINFVVYDTPEWENGFKGHTNQDIYFDNEVLDMIALNFTRKINAQYGKKRYG